MVTHYELEKVPVSGRGGKREGAGRPKKAQKEVGVSSTIYLSQEDLQYLLSWGSTPTLGVRRMLERARLMWPKGE